MPVPTDLSGVCFAELDASLSLLSLFEKEGWSGTSSSGEGDAGDRGAVGTPSLSSSRIFGVGGSEVSISVSILS